MGLFLQTHVQILFTMFHVTVVLGDVLHLLRAHLTGIIRLMFVFL